ncbi:MAG: ABC transporter substrate-binding protein, partial [Mesorhizobium sp.]
AKQHKTDIVFGTLFSHVVIGSAPAAGENKIPYFVVSEGHHVASTKLNRYVFQPGITDVKSQIQSMAPWIAANAGKKVTQIFPDFAFGYDHRDYLPPALKAQGADVIAQIAIPPTESSFTKYFPQIPAETEVIYHVMVGPAVLTFVKELGEFYGSQRPQLFGFMDSLEAVDINSPGLEFLDGSHFWEGSPRYAQPDDSAAQKAYRAAVGIDDNGAAVGDPKDISTASHMFGCWETLYVVKKAMEDAGYKGPEDRAKLVEATEALKEFAEGPEHPQGPKTFNGKIHQCFGIQNISKVEGGKLKVVHKTKIEDGLYEPEGDYTTQAL